MPDNQSEESKLLDELNQNDLFKNPNMDEENPFLVKKEEQIETVSEDEYKNRRERRQADKIRQLKEETNILNERLKQLAEMKKEIPSSEDADYLKKVERIFGTADEKGNYDPGRAQATEYLKSALAEAVADAERRALEKFEARQSELSESARREEAEAEEYLQESLEEVEDKYGINMDSPKERNAYLELLEEMSPKDREGNIKEYADPDAVAKTYIKLRSSSTSQAKSVASRSMTQGSTSGASKVEEDATLRWLKQNDLI